MASRGLDPVSVSGHSNLVTDVGLEMFKRRIDFAHDMGVGIINTGAAHALGYGIEKVSHTKGRPVPHGAAVALVLPGVMRHNTPAAGEKYYYTAGVAGVDLRGMSQEEGAVLAAEWGEGSGSWIKR